MHAGRKGLEMRTIRLIVIASLAAALAAGCTTSSDDGNGGSGGSESYPPYEPPTNGVAMGEMEACETLVNTFAEAATELQCTFTLPTCPNYVRSSGAPECSQYDEGSILGCAAFYASFDSCDDFAKKGCHIHNIADSAPNGCPADDADAGADADQGDAADTDAESNVDAEANDAEPDAASSDDAAVADGQTAD